MADLDYFSANDPAAAPPFSGRLVAAGIICLIVALLLGFVAVMLGSELYRMIRYPYRQEWLAVIPPWLAVAGSTVFFAIIGLGLLTRRRWSRPLVLIYAAIWLTHGAAIFLVGFCWAAIDVYRQTADGFRYFSWEYFFKMVGLSLASLGFATIGMPAIFLLLLQPTHTQRTLELYDFRPRWTDGLPQARAAVVMNVTVLAAVALWFWANWPSRYWIDSHDGWLAVAFAVTPLPLIIAAGLLAFGGVRRQWAAIGLMSLCFALFVYAGFSRGPRSNFRYSDATSFLAYFLAVTAACLMQTRRLIRASMR